MKQGLLVLSPVTWSPGPAPLQQVGYIPHPVKVAETKGSCPGSCLPAPVPIGSS